MKITKDTRVSDILLEYGDIADVMEIFGVQRVGKYSLRIFLIRLSLWNGQRRSIACR